MVDFTRDDARFARTADAWAARRWHEYPVSVENVCDALVSDIFNVMPLRASVTVKDRSGAFSFCSTGVKRSTMAPADQRLRAPLERLRVPQRPQQYPWLEIEFSHHLSQ
jgi:hypothetical protein